MRNQEPEKTIDQNDFRHSTLQHNAQGNAADYIPRTQILLTVAHSLLLFFCSSQDSILHSWTYRHNLNMQPLSQTVSTPKTNSELRPWSTRGYLSSIKPSLVVVSVIKYTLPESFGMTYSTTCHAKLSASCGLNSNPVLMFDTRVTNHENTVGRCFTWNNLYRKGIDELETKTKSVRAGLS